MLSVISPAKILNEEPPPPSLPLTTPALLDEAHRLAKTARNLTQKQLRELMKLSPKLAKLNADRFKQFAIPARPELLKQAALMFNGEAYASLDAPSLDADALAHAQQHLGILSGLYGLLRPMDGIQPYRLEMGTRLRTRRGASLYAFWGARITNRINEILAGHAHKHLINLASSEYFKAIKRSRLNAPVLTVDFREYRGGQPVMIGFNAKRARGLMARYIIDQRVDNLDGLRGFDAAGYAFDAALSGDETWTFSRPG
jgi:uncharacterized protein